MIGSCPETCSAVIVYRCLNATQQGERDRVRKQFMGQADVWIQLARVTLGYLPPTASREEDQP